MTTTQVLKQETIKVPQNKGEADEAVLAMGKLQRQIKTEGLDLNNRIESQKSASKVVTGSLEKKIDTLFEGVKTFAIGHEAELTQDKQTVVVSSGSFGWRWTRNAVAVENEEEVLEEAKKNFPQFVRYTPTLDKDMMLRYPELALKIPGVTISKKREFFVKPSETEVAEKATLATKRLKATVQVEEIEIVESASAGTAIQQSA